MKLILAILICLLVGFLGSIFTMSAIPTWYATLNKPFFSPPNWLFAPVWTTLYILMGISLYLILNKKKVDKTAVMIFVVQLVLNFLWSIMFFGLHSPFLGLINIILLWLTIVWTIISFMKVSKTAGYLLFPYILWVSFASLLNLAVYLLNK